MPRSRAADPRASLDRARAAVVTVFELDTGKVLMEETEVPGGMKFEGLEFVQW